MGGYKILPITGRAKGAGVRCVGHWLGKRKKHQRLVWGQNVKEGGGWENKTSGGWGGKKVGVRDNGMNPKK